MNADVPDVQPSSLAGWRDRTLPPLGVGAMPFSWAPVADHDHAVAVLLHAFGLGFTLVNTADVYAPSAADVGHNERLVGEAVRAFGRERLTVVTKNGIRRDGERWWRDNSRDWMLRAAERSNRMLGFVPDVIAVHRVDRARPWRECVEGLLEVRERGLARRIGLSNVTRAEFDEAWRVSGGTVAICEQERSPYYREHADVLDACGEHGVAYLAWSPLGGAGRAARLAEDYPEFHAVAARLGTTAHNVALAWLMARGRHCIPIPAFTRAETATRAAAAAGLRLGAADVSALDASQPRGSGVAGDF